MEHENKPISVYVKTDETGRVIGINSDAFLSSLDGWQKVDEGYGDKFHHAQGNYLEMPLTDENGAHRYKLENGKPVERTAEEMAADVREEQAQPSQEERIANLEEALEMLLSGVTE